MICNPPTVLDQTLQQLTALNSCGVRSHAGASIYYTFCYFSTEE